jgi:hypothetical protein
MVAKRYQQRTYVCCTIPVEEKRRYVMKKELPRDYFDLFSQNKGLEG